MFVSPPVADKLGALPVAALATVNSLTAEPVVENLICSFELSSRIAFVLSIIFCALVSKSAESCGENLMINLLNLCQQRLFHLNKLL